MDQLKQEMKLWQEAYLLALAQDPDIKEAAQWADSAVVEFRKRYQPQQSTPQINQLWADIKLKRESEGDKCQSK